MQAKNITWLSLVLFASAPWLLQAAPTQAQLVTHAKIKESEAKKIALERVPNGSIKSAEIENENGHLVWSFDISKPSTRDITEILVDAKTGKIISLSKETPKQQAAEAKADKQKQ